MSTTSSTSSTVSVAGSSSADAAGGSVIDVSSLVSQLVTASQAPQESIITARTTAVTAQISNLGTLKSALSTFQESLGSLDTAKSFNVQTAVSSDVNVFTATATANAPTGTYSVAVTHLAQAQQLLSGPLTTNSDGTLGAGSLTLSVGGSSFTVTTSGGTPAQLAKAINSASGNTGITATIISGTDGNHLLLSASNTGADSNITVSASESDGGTTLSQLDYDPAAPNTDTSNYTVQTDAQDAAYSIAGVPRTSANNTITDVLDGVTLTLTGTTDASSSDTLTINTNTSTVESNIKSFVSAYNTLLTSLTSLGGYDSTTGTAGAMMGDPTLTGIQNQITRAVHSLINTGSATYNSLASIGITTDSSTGQLNIDSDTLETALSSNFSAVSAMFSGTNGIATTINTALTNTLSSDGSIAQRSASLVTQENALTQQSADLTTRMTALSASLTTQYTALNTLLSSLQTTSAYLTQAFSSLPKVQNSSS